ncbi:MAG: HAD-IB family phosphatase [Dehalococcoidia bacterium]|nr:HAD-IB family phosphatase [Dehalococcoidia bacterium]
MMKTLVQCDFDGTITEADASFFLLGAFAQGDWRQLLRQYKEHKISVGEFNTRAFAMVRADKSTLLEAIKRETLPSSLSSRGVKMRDGFRELVNYCAERGFRLVIVSNGLDFYIREILKQAGLESIEVHAAQTQFHPSGVEVRYIGPDGSELDDGLKEAYIRLFLEQGYRVIYVGNGDSDISPARYAYQIFATGELLGYCRENNLECKPFNDLTDVVSGLELL